MKKKCLIIIPGIPYPPTSGYRLKIFNLVKILNLNYDVDIVSISRHALSANQEKFIKSHSSNNKHFKISSLHIIKCCLFYLFQKKPLQVSIFSISAVEKYLTEKKTKFDFVFFNLIRTADYINIFSGATKVLDMVDLISRNCTSSIKNTSSTIHRFFYEQESKRLLPYENQAVDSVDLTLFVNLKETEIMRNYGNVEWLPNGVNPHLFAYNKRDKTYKNCVVFFGTMSYQPNIDAVIWFNKNVLDGIHPSIKLYIIGDKPSMAIKRLAKLKKNVILTGFLEDPYLILNSCFAVIAPMQNGGGIQNKVLEAMGLGKVNIISSYAADPIVGGVDNKHFIVADSSTEMIEKINDVFLNQNNYIEVGKRAKELILDRYTWKSYAEHLLKVMERAI